MRQAIFLIIFFSTFLLGSLHTSAQTAFKCGTIVPHSYLESQTRSIPGYFGCEQINKVNRKLSILFQVVKDSLGFTGVSDGNLQAAVDLLNQFWEPTGISFEFCERRDLDNHQFNEFDVAEEADDMHAMYYEPNIINIFVTSTITMPDGEQAAGYAYLPGGLDIIHISKSTMSTMGSGALVHEMGHFLGLLHTFSTGMGVELVDGSNCGTSGDLVCDTEANPTDDPLDFDEDCNYIGTPATDSMGNFYVPPATNIMSYSPCGCQFTKQQYNRMVEQYLLFRNYLW